MLDMTAAARAGSVLSQLGEALEAGDIARATGLFADTCYWRDLVAFTWNIKTMEGRPAIAEMLGATLAHVKPSGWSVDET